jgi:pimeloyl-ACP methyl ester carboxylesterase
VSADPYNHIFDRTGSLIGPTLWDLVAEGRAALYGRLFGPRRAAVPLPRGDGHTVIVLPALFCSDLMTKGFRTQLAALDYAVEGWGGGINLGPTQAAVEAVERLMRHGSPSRKVSLVGVSLGGVLARVLANTHPDRVRRVITVCSPFRLPTASPLEPIYRALAPLHSGEAVLMAQLTAPPPVPTTAIYTPRDGVVAWRSCIDEPGPDRENIAIDGTHSTMLENPRTLRVIAERLARP